MKRPFGVSLLALGHILFGLLGSVWVLVSGAGSCAQHQSGACAMAGFFIVGPVLFNGFISIPLGVALWRRFSLARAGVVLYALLWMLWGIFLIPYSILIVGYGIAAALYLRTPNPKEYLKQRADRVVKIAIAIPIVLILIAAVLWFAVFFMLSIHLTTNFQSS